MAGAYAVGATVGLTVGALAGVALVTWVTERVGRAATLPDPAEPSAVVVDLAGRRSTRSWSA